MINQTPSSIYEKGTGAKVLFEIPYSIIAPESVRVFVGSIETTAFTVEGSFVRLETPPAPQATVEIQVRVDEASYTGAGFDQIYQEVIKAAVLEALQQYLAAQKGDIQSGAAVDYDTIYGKVVQALVAYEASQKGDIPIAPLTYSQTIQAVNDALVAFGASQGGSTGGGGTANIDYAQVQQAVAQALAAHPAPTLQQLKDEAASPAEVEAIVAAYSGPNDQQTFRFYQVGEVIRFANAEVPPKFERIAGNNDVSIENTFLLSGSLSASVFGSPQLGAALIDGFVYTYTVNNLNEALILKFDSQGKPAGQFSTGLSGIDGLSDPNQTIFGHSKVNKSYYVYLSSISQFSIFDVVTGSFSPATSPTIARRDGILIGGNDGLVYLFGGATNTVDSTTPVNQTASYNRNTNTWTNINAPLPSYPASIPVGLRFASALLPSGNFLLVYGNRWAVFNPVNRTYPSSGTTPFLYCTGLTESKNGAIGLFYTNTPNQQDFYTFAEGQGWGQMFITLDANSNLLNNGQGTPYPLYEGALANLGNDSGVFTTYRVNDGVLTKTHMLNLGYSPSPIYYIKRTVA